MALLDRSRRRGYEQRYRAAWLVLLADFTFRQLTAADQDRVHQTTVKYLLEGGWNVLVYPRGSNVLIPEYLLTMNWLGIPPALEGTLWGVPRWVRERHVGSLGPLQRTPMRGAGREWPLLRNYRQNDPATVAARQKLIEIGASFPESPSPVDEMLNNRAKFLGEYEKKRNAL